jgi:hypothetical protein
MLIMRKLIGATAAILAGLALALSLTAPASAGGSAPGSPPAPVTTTTGCQGSQCSTLLSQIRLTGDAGGGGGSFTPIALGPAPCIWNPIGNAQVGSTYVIGFVTAVDTEFEVGLLLNFLTEAEQILKANPQGEWYLLTSNPSDDAAETAACDKEPPFVWVPAGGQPPTPPVPPEFLAKFAYNHFTIPVPKVQISPPNKGVVDLATYLWANWPASAATGQEDTYQITATLGNTTVTVQAKAQALTITPVGPGTAFTTGCGPNGSKSPLGQPPATAGAGATPDCGVMWDGPDATAGITATATWDVTWFTNNGVVHQLPNIAVTSTQANIRVSEIQGIN